MLLYFWKLTSNSPAVVARSLKGPRERRWSVVLERLLWLECMSWLLKIHCVSWIDMERQTFGYQF